MNTIEAKVVVLGSQGVGKTSVVVRYVAKTFQHNVSPTIGASFFTCKVTLDDFRVKLQVWDTAGQERFRSMAPMYYRNCNAAILMYDITSKDSFDLMKTWVSEVRNQVENEVVLCVLGNKKDLAGKQRQVKREIAKTYADSIGAFFSEASAASNEGIEETFLHLAKGLVGLCKRTEDSGINMIESYKSWEVDSLTTSRDTVETNFHGNITISQRHEGKTEEPCFLC